MTAPACTGCAFPARLQPRLFHITLLQARTVKERAAGSRRLKCTAASGENKIRLCCLFQTRQTSQRHQNVEQQLQIATCHSCCSADHTAAPPEGGSSTETDGNTRANKRKPAQSSWNAKHAGAAADTQSDFLSNLGEGQDYNINVDHGECCNMLDPSLPCLSVPYAVTS